MSELAKMRQELRQGLHQYLMQLYMSYLDTMNVEDAKFLVAEEIKEQYQLFLGGKIEANMVLRVLREKHKEIEELMKKQADYDSQLFYAEKIDALNSAIEVLETT